jgi:hypothetical protein
LFQWHDPARIAAFKKLYGHDISQANAAEQLDFALIEMKALNLNTNETVGPRYAASVVTKKFERPKDRIGESEKRGNYAASLLHGVPGSSSVGASTFVKGGSSSTSTDNSKTTHIGSITIQNPAGTDPMTPSMARGMDWTTLLTQQNTGLF